jgi:mediator of RNA polymerase II transcription subunit 12
MITCNLAQAGFLARLAEEYLDDIMTSRALARPLVEGCLAKLMEVSNESTLGL